jgi:hypothetical protein
MMRRTYKPGDPVVFQVTKQGFQPQRAENLRLARLDNERLNGF